MPNPDYSYRPNPKRAIYLTGQFTDDLSAKVLPAIMELRISTDPITIYINSPGGSLAVLDTIHGALACKDSDDRVCRLKTVALGEASSAAATLLVLGDYSIVHPHTIVHFHGARLADIDVMTMEHASSYAQRLMNLNRQYALKMARKSIDRIVRRYVQLLPDIAKDDPGSEGDIADFVQHIKLRTSLAADRVLDRTMSLREAAQELCNNVLTGIQFDEAQKGIDQDMMVFKALLDHEVKEKGYEGFRLNDYELQEILGDYSMVRDYVLGEHYRSMRTIIRSQGPALLKKEDLSAFLKLLETSDKETLAAWLFERVGRTLRELWHFAVLLCRELQAGENHLTAEDVYWLGCVDEILGSEDCHGERADVEADIILDEAEPAG